jgi:hypothetical protein
MVNEKALRAAVETKRMKGWWVAFCIGIIFQFLVRMGKDIAYYHVIPRKEWQCTQSVVVKPTLPRQEECTQYTKEAK